jgi:hypothetical protein
MNKVLHHREGSHAFGMPGAEERRLVSARCWNGVMTPDLPLLIDQQAATVPISESDIHAWGARQRVFVSSLITDMRAERAAVRRAIESVGATPIMFEDLGGRDTSAEEAYLSGVRTADIYVGVLGSRYGVALATGYSATHAEYVEAERSGLRMALFVQEGVAMEGPQQDLVAGARNSYTTSPWSSLEELERRVASRLREIAAEAVAPWVRIGRLVLRADGLRVESGRVTVRATVRDRTVFAELRQMADRKEMTRFATTWQAESAQVASLESDAQSANRIEVTVGLAVRANSATSMRMSINGLSAEELARRSLSDGLFGTQTLPQGLLAMSKPVEPLSPLRGRGLADDIVRPIAHLLIAEHLLLGEEAATIDDFRLGPRRNGARLLSVTWTPPRRYVNSPDADPVVLEGATIDL